VRHEILRGGLPIAAVDYCAARVLDLAAEIHNVVGIHLNNEPLRLC